MTELLLVRHARAAATNRRSAERDRARPLTRRGRRQARRTASALRQLGVTLDRLYYAPSLRCVQTADGLVGLLEGESVVTKRLGHAPSHALLTEISGERVALVGHEPHLGALAGLLVAGAARASLGSKPSGVVWLEGDLRPGGMRVRAVLPPRVLRALARDRQRQRRTP